MLNINQTNAIKSWSEQRDELIQGNARLTDSNNKLTKDGVELGKANAEMTNQIFFKKGVIATLDEGYEKQLKMIPVELMEGKKKITLQQRKIDENDTIISAQEIKKTDIEKSLLTLVPIYQTVTTQVTALNETIDKVVKINDANIVDVNIMIANLKEALGDNLSKLVLVLDDLPKKLNIVTDTIQESTKLSNKNADTVDNLIKKLEIILPDNK